jgi:hypothetical protein
MTQDYIQRLNTFTISDLPDLDEVVLGALQLFEKTELPKITLRDVYKRPLIVGSGNAEATGRIIFKDFDALFASESDFEQKLNHIQSIDGVVVVSASGGKHAPAIVKAARAKGKPVTLITTTKNSLASKELDQTYQHAAFIFPKNREPYTYNTSTYMGMILGHTGESAADIQHFIQEHVAGLDFSRMEQFSKFYLIIPAHLTGIIRMLHVKFIELFGRQVARDIESAEYVRHATTVVPSKELFISFGDTNESWGVAENRLHVPLPAGAQYGAMMAIGYFVVAQIQKRKPAYFKENIVSYTQQVSEVFGQEIKAIVE